MQTSIIYLLGAGRSGTTLLAAVLNSHLKITTIGEMHQFFEHLEQDKKCSCGAKLDECSFWSDVVSKLNFSKKEISVNVKTQEQKENHSNIFKLLFTKQLDNEYLNIQNSIFELIQKHTKTEWLLDSSKYIARYLLLKKGKKANIKGIYIVRDVRGVINSFNKQVQTPKNPLSTILYYSFVNFFGQITCWLNKDILKIRYEDFASTPEEVTNSIYQHIFENPERNSLSNVFEMPHIIGGNRMKESTSISIKKDENWKQDISRTKQIAYYILAFPFMTLNNYKI